MLAATNQPVRSVFVLLLFFAGNYTLDSFGCRVLALALIFVYIGAVMTLFYLYLMLNVDSYAPEYRFDWYFFCADNFFIITAKFWFIYGMLTLIICLGYTYFSSISARL